MTFDPGAGLEASTLQLADGRDLRYVHAGSGGPVVVFEAGMGAGASEWVTVQRIISATTRTVSYDRAGQTSSTPDKKPRTLERICEDLHALIEHVSPDAPVVLVGHSWGGPMVRCYSELHPDRVAGIVLIDTTISAVMPPAISKIMPMMMRFTVLLHRVGLGKAYMDKAMPVKPSDELPAADIELFRRDMNDIGSARTMLAEAKVVSATVPHMKRMEEKGLPPVPVLSLVAEGKPREQKGRAKSILPHFEQEMARHPHGTYQLVKDTGHFVPQERPKITADAILTIVDTVRDS